MVGAVALTAVVVVPLSSQPGHRPQPRDRCRHGAGVDLALPTIAPLELGASVLGTASGKIIR